MRVVWMSLVAGATLAVFPSTGPLISQTPQAWAATVTGEVVNGTAGGVAPTEGSIMLHVWDGAGAEQFMADASLSQGTFRLEGVPIAPGWMVAAMMNYGGTVYPSEPVIAGPDPVDPRLTITVYEATSDVTAVSIDSLHVFFTFQEELLAVGELYLISNRGDRTVAAAVESDGVGGPLQLPLPAGALLVQFPQGEEERYSLAGGGFVDRAPLRPGTQTGQIYVSYRLAYESEMIYQVVANYPVEAISFLVPTGSGVQLRGRDLLTLEPRTLRDGQVFSVYGGPGLEVGERYAVSLSGAPVPSSGTNSAAWQSPGSAWAMELERNGLAMGVASLGAALIFVGIWLWRRPRASGPIEDDWADEVASMETAQGPGPPGV